MIELGSLRGVSMRPSTGRMMRKWMKYQAAPNSDSVGKIPSGGFEPSQPSMMQSATKIQKNSLYHGR